MEGAFRSVNQASVDAANAWLARFAPVLMNESVSDAGTLRKQLRTLRDLREEAIRRNFRGLDWEGEASELGFTLRQALDQVDSLEESFRQRLATVAPGDPEGIVDLDKLQARLAERSARMEIGAVESVPTVLEMSTGQPNLGAAAATGLFGLGWTAFTTFHCVLMVGGMFRAFGPPALALLLFYSIFFFVGFSMLSTAYTALCDESITLDGTTLRVRRTLNGKTKEKVYAVNPKLSVTIGKSASPMGKGNATIKAAIFTTTDGKPVYVGASATPSHREEIMKAANAYLRSQR